ncbi:MAG TPA: SRPBCC family protein [Rhizomicrobium sp.]|jgi:uncharacterized protein YndB with AHSA1/START domain
MNAPVKITPAPVKKTIRVQAPQAKAFDVFTRIDGWWPKGHHVGKAPLKTAIIEPFVGGRWYHISEDGSEDVTGYVRAWQPPERLVVSWRLNSKFVADDSVDSEVEVHFIAESPTTTRVELEHRVTAVDGEAISTAVGAPNGWTAIMEIYAQSVEAAS